MNTQTYTSVSLAASKQVTKRYSTSFSLGILAFGPSFRSPIYAIYGFVRLADEIVDSFHEFDKKHLLDQFRRHTFEAIESGISTNPILHAFQHTVNVYGIERELIGAFLDSMEMDLSNTSYHRSQYDTYVYGSAEVVGLMCLRVFCNGDDALFNELAHSARSLGSAFQKVNFLRDIRSDLHERGRIYLPGVRSPVAISDRTKQMLEEEIEREFQEALAGIRRLPTGVKLGVYTAYIYYFVLFKKIRRINVSDLMQTRVRLSDLTKIALLCRSILTVRFLR